MKKRFMSTLLMGAFFLAATSMFVSCKDYDDDINANTKAIQNVESTLKAQIAELNSALQQEKTAATAAHSQYVDAIAKAQAAADAAQKSLADAIAAANSSHATKTELSEGLAPKANRDEVTAAIAELKTSLNDAINAGDNATAQAAQAALTAAIDKVNASLEGVKGDLATVTNAQTEIKNTLTTAIATLDKKANQTMVDAAVNALNTALAEVKQSAATKEAVQNAIDLAKGEIAKNVQAVEAAAAKAQADATSAQQDLAKLAEKVNTYAAAQAAAEAKIEQLQKAIAAANELEGKLQEAIAGNSKDIATLRADLTQGVANLDAQIKSVNENLSKLIAANTNTIQDLAGTVGNIRLQINALENFCGNLEALNVPGIRDSMRLSFAQLKQAEQTARENLAAAEVRAAETAAGYVAALAEVMKDSAEAMKKRAQEQAVEAQKQTEEAIAEAKQAVIDYVDAFEIDDLWDNVNDLNAEVYGEGGINDQLEFINKTLTWSASGKPINLEEVLISLAKATFTNGLAIDSLEEVGLGYDLWKAEIDQFVQDVKDNKANYITVTAAHKYADDAVKTAVDALKLEDAETYVAKAALKAMVTAFLADVDMAENYKAAGLALDADIKTWVKDKALADYLKTNDLAGAIEALETYLPKDEVVRIANKARTDARADALEDTKAALAEYDKALADSFNELFEQLNDPDAQNEAQNEAQEEADGDDDGEKTPAQIAIINLATKLKNSINISEQAKENVNVLRIQFASSLTSLVFYPEVYYGGIEAIEITAFQIENTYKMVSDNDVRKLKTELEVWEEQLPDRVKGFYLYPNGFAKYHYNPVSTDLSDYQLSFIDHFAATRATNVEQSSYLKVVETDAEKNVNPDATVNDDLLWVEFENDETIFGNILKKTRIPSFAHNLTPVTRATGEEPTGGYDEDDDEEDDDDEYVAVTSHYVYGDGKDNGGIITALVATDETPEKDEDGKVMDSYVASDYALIVPVQIKNLFLAQVKPTNLINTYEKSTDEDWANYNYYCEESTNFHLYTTAVGRAEDAIKGYKWHLEDGEVVGDDDVEVTNSDGTISTINPYTKDGIAVIKLPLKGEFNLADWVETHYSSSLGKGASDKKMDQIMFDKLGLAYRFTPVDYTRGNNGTSETLFLTLTAKDEKGYYNGKGYFNAVEDKYENGKIVTDKKGRGIGQKKEGANSYSEQYEDAIYAEANNAALGRRPMVRVELYNKEKPELVYAIGYLKVEISNDIEREPEIIDNINVLGNIFASCGYEDEVVTTWDQIQAGLNNLMKDENGVAQGLSPKVWNQYEIEYITNSEVSESAKIAAQYYDDDNNPETKPVLISKVFEADKKSDDYYPYYYLGNFDLVDGGEVQGVHTKVIRWKFSQSAYQALFYEYQANGAPTSWINKTTGVYQRAQKRYIKLVNKQDSSYPDIYVGINLPSESIRFAAGTIGKIKNAYWKKTANNAEGAKDEDNTDMVINVKLNASSTDAASAVAAPEVTNQGKLWKKILHSFFGEKVIINPNLSDITDKQLKAKAEKMFATVADAYSETAKFYFRAPTVGLEGVKDEANRRTQEGKVIENGEWVAYGISGLKYTLLVTDSVKFDTEDPTYWMPYGSSVSIVKINDMYVDEFIEAYNDETTAYNELMFEGKPITELLPNIENADGSINWTDGKIIPVEDKGSVHPALVAMTVDNDNDAQVELCQHEFVKGFTQDMLNKVAHDDHTGGDASYRGYDRQLTAFMVLLSDDFQYVVDPETTIIPDGTYEDKASKPLAGDVCYLLPGIGQDPDCFKCNPKVKTKDLPDYDPFEYCYKPFVNDFVFAVRFIRPITLSVTGSKEIQDAKLSEMYNQELTPALSASDWAGYVMGDSDFKNFMTYYDIKWQLDPALLKSSYYKAPDNVANIQAPWEFAETDERYISEADVKIIDPTFKLVAGNTNAPDAGRTDANKGKTANHQINVTETAVTGTRPANAEGIVDPDDDEFGTFAEYLTANAADYNTDPSYREDYYVEGTDDDGNIIYTINPKYQTIYEPANDEVEPAIVEHGFAYESRNLAVMLTGANKGKRVDTWSGTEYVNYVKVTDLYEDPGTESQWVAEQNKALPADQQIENPGDGPAAVEHPGTIKDYNTWIKETITPTLEEGQTWADVRVNYIVGETPGYQPTDANWVSAKSSSTKVCTVNTPEYDSETAQYSLGENENAPTVAPTANSTDERYIAVYNSYQTYWPQYKNYVQQYNQQLSAYNTYLKNKEVYDAKKAIYDGQIAKYNALRAGRDYLDAELDAIQDYNEDIMDDYEAAKDLFDTWIADAEQNTANSENANAIKKYNAYWKTMDDQNKGANSGADLAAKAEVLKAVKNILRTDNATAKEDRAKLTDATIAELPTLAESGLQGLHFEDFAVDETTKKITFTYRQDESFTNQSFSIYIPIQVTYCYLNKVPAAPYVSWAKITITSTKANLNTARRK